MSAYKKRPIVYFGDFFLVLRCASSEAWTGLSRLLSGEERAEKVALTASLILDTLLTWWSLCWGSWWRLTTHGCWRTWKERKTVRRSHERKYINNKIHLQRNKNGFFQFNQNAISEESKWLWATEVMERWMGKSEFWTIETTRKWLSVIFQVKKKINLVSLNS